MPQMAPMNWLYLFISFVMIFILSINKIFYTSMNKTNDYNNYNSISISKLNLWKW